MQLNKLFGNVGTFFFNNGAQTVQCSLVILLRFWDLKAECSAFQCML